ncbi:MAG: UDP-diphosphatase, partial [Ignavibacteria bacterium]|nr:UDP-diphosphatase [Ignavibacteria bacterium]
VIAISLIVLALILLLDEKIAKLPKSEKDLTFWDALVVGLAQCVALIPGSSRSGTTITAGLFLGMNRATAARFSFLLSIPAIFASGVLQFYQALSFVSAGEWFNILVATLVSAISGYFAIDFLIKYLKKHSTYIFIFYRIIIGIAILIFIYAK